MTKRLSYTMLAVAATLAAADDPAGWSKARWGMTEAQLVRAFGTEAVRLDPPEQMGTSAAQAASLAKLQADLQRLRANGWRTPAAGSGQPETPAKPAVSTAVMARIAVQPFQLAGTTFRALMVPDQAGRLNSILLSPLDHADETDTLFDSLEQMLVQKYGRPWVTPDGRSAEVQWTIQTTVITLTRWHPSLSGDLYVSVQYKRRPAPRL